MARILIVIPYYGFFPPRNGGQLRCFYLLQELARAHEVHGIIFQPESDLRNPRDGYRFPESVKVYGPAQTPLPRTFFDRLPGRWGPALHYRWLQRSWRGPASSVLLETHHLIRQILAENGIDVVVLTGLVSAPAAPYVKRLCPQAVRILNTENVEHHLVEQAFQCHNGNQSELQTLKKSYARALWYESRLGQFVDCFFACSESDRKVLESLNRGEVKGFIVPNGVDTQARPFDNRPDKSRSNEILFCGSLNYSPNRDGLLWFYREVWPLILNHQPSLRLVVIGRGAAPGDFSLLQTDPTVDFLGEVEDVVPYYQRTGVAVVPLRMGSGARLKILEAMSLGNPIVSTRIGAQGIDATDGEHLLVADEPTQFAVAVDRLLTYADTFEKVRRTARELVETRYDWAVIGNIMNQAIEDLLRQRELERKTREVSGR